MRSITLPLPQFGFVVATRAALGAGIALLVSQSVSPPRRRAVGLALLGLGAAATVPAIRWASGGLRRAKYSGDRDPGLIGAKRYPRKGDDDFV
jgi:hypothetical protein